MSSPDKRKQFIENLKVYGRVDYTILEEDMDLNFAKLDSNENTILHILASKKSTDELLKYINYLKEKSQRFDNYINRVAALYNRRGQTVWSILIDSEKMSLEDLLTFLIESGVSVSILDGNNRSPLASTALKLSELISNGAKQAKITEYSRILDLFLNMTKDKTAKLSTLQNWSYHVKAVKDKLQKNVNIKEKTGGLENSSPKTIDKWFQQVSPLLETAQYGTTNTEPLFDLTKVIKDTNGKDISIFEYLIVLNKSELLRNILARLSREKAVTMVNQRGPSGFSPLVAVVGIGSVQLAEVLLEYGADPLADVSNENKHTILYDTIQKIGSETDSEKRGRQKQILRMFLENPITRGKLPKNLKNNNWEATPVDVQEILREFDILGKTQRKKETNERLAAEQERRRLANERLKANAAAAAAAKAEQARLAAEAERARQAAEEARLAAEAERVRQAAEEAERIRLAAEEARQAAEEAERVRLAAEEAERVRLAAEEAERARLAEEAEAEAERARKAAAEKAKRDKEEAEALQRQRERNEEHRRYIAEVKRKAAEEVGAFEAEIAQINKQIEELSKKKEKTERDPQEYIKFRADVARIHLVQQQQMDAIIQPNLPRVRNLEVTTVENNDLIQMRTDVERDIWNDVIKKQFTDDRTRASCLERHNELVGKYERIKALQKNAWNQKIRAGATATQKRFTQEQILYCRGIMRQIAEQIITNYNNCHPLPLRPVEFSLENKNKWIAIKKKDDGAFVIESQDLNAIPAVAPQRDEILATMLDQLTDQVNQLKQRLDVGIARLDMFDRLKRYETENNTLLQNLSQLLENIMGRKPNPILTTIQESLNTIIASQAEINTLLNEEEPKTVPLDERIKQQKAKLLDSLKRSVDTVPSIKVQVKQTVVQTIQTTEVVVKTKEELYKELKEGLKKESTSDSTLKTLINGIFTDDKTRINEKDLFGRTLLMRLIIHNHFDAALRLVELGAEVNIQDNDGLTALMLAIGNTNPLNIFERGALRLLQKLVNLPSIDVNLRETERDQDAYDLAVRLMGRIRTPEDQTLFKREIVNKIYEQRSYAATLYLKRKINKLLSLPDFTFGGGADTYAS